jgi:hypothetical protein
MTRTRRASPTTTANCAHAQNLKERDCSRSPCSALARLQARQDAVMRSLGLPTAADYRAHVDRVLERHKIRAVWKRLEDMPPGASAYADWRTRTITCPPVCDAESFAVALHECGHLIAGVCRGEGHYRDPAVRAWHHCLACERLAWSHAIRLSRPIPWSRVMQARLRRSLEIYRRQTPAWPRVKAEAARLTLERSRLEEMQARLTRLTTMAERQQWLALVKKDIAGFTSHRY